MPARMRIAAILSAILLAPALLCAQDTQSQTDASSQPPGPHLKLVYRTLQIGADGKMVSSHSYSTIVVANTGTRFAVPNSQQRQSSDCTGNPSGGNTQYQYQDVGTNIDTYGAKLGGNQLTLGPTVDPERGGEEVTSRPKRQSPSGRPAIEMAVRCDRDVGRPTVIFTSDNPSDTGKNRIRTHRHRNQAAVALLLEPKFRNGAHAEHSQQKPAKSPQPELLALK